MEALENKNTTDESTILAKQASQISATPGLLAVDAECENAICDLDGVFSGG
jgi:hypothetical protein